MLSVAVYMACSANGMVNDGAGRTPWCDDEWVRYGKVLAQAGCLIVGRRTHEIMSACGEYERLGIARVVVLTRQEIDSRKGMTTAKTPQQALDQLSAEGFQKVIVGGGTETNQAFLTAGLVQEIYLDIEPVLFSKGLPFLNTSIDLTLDLRLLEVDRYSKNSMGLRYSVQDKITPSS